MWIVFVKNAKIIVNVQVKLVKIMFVFAKKKHVQTTSFVQKKLQMEFVSNVLKLIHADLLLKVVFLMYVYATVLNVELRLQDFSVIKIL